MRLFYAITFNEIVRRKLAAIQDALRVEAVRGSFTHFENLHLTLAFIGEVAPARAQSLMRIAGAFHLTPFQIRIRGIGSFRREGGSIVWAGIEDSGSLTETHARLAWQVVEAGFRLEERKFTPHLTLARQVRFREGFDLRVFSDITAPIDATVKRVSLMQSERINGKLVYTEIG